MKRATHSGLRALSLLVQRVFLAPINLAGAPAGALLPRNEDLYLDNVMLARRRANSS